MMKSLGFRLFLASQKPPDSLSFEASSLRHWLKGDLRNGTSPRSPSELPWTLQKWSKMELQTA